MTAVLGFLNRHRAWLVMALLLLLVGVVRFRLRDMPLERDEGEFAYVGQLLLQGIPPYQLAYSMKFPGIYGAYALVMLVFGQTAAGIHAGLLIVNLTSIILVFWLGQRLLDLNGGLVAATTFALLSSSVAVLGLAAHASHFVVLAALGGTLLLLRAVGAGSDRGLSHLGLCFGSGALFGVALLIKQPAILWAMFGMLYLAWSEFGLPVRNLLSERRRGSPARRGRHHRARLQRRANEPRFAVQLGEAEAPLPRPSPLGEGREGIADSPSTSPRSPMAQAWKKGLVRCACYGLGLTTPLLLMCLLLWRAGVFDRFVFWTFTYANEYVALRPLFKIPTEHFRSTLGVVVGSNLVLWLLAVLGMLLLWWDERLRSRRLFLCGFAIVSLMAVCPGWYLRQHYFVFALPAVALLTAVAVNRGLYLLRHDRTIELFLALAIVGLFPVGLVTTLVGSAPVWFALGPVAACREVYPFQMFAENAELAEFIRENSRPDARIAVLGSEPEICFYARRHSATGYIYVYPLMEPHKYAMRMQEEMIREIEAARPEFLVFVKVQYSWAMWPESQKIILDWYAEYTRANYDLVKMVKDPIEPTPEQLRVEPGLTPGLLLLYQRKPAIVGRH
jgi:hypothetical protein